MSSHPGDEGVDYDRIEVDAADVRSPNAQAADEATAALASLNPDALAKRLQYLLTQLPEDKEAALIKDILKAQGKLETLGGTEEVDRDPSRIANNILDLLLDPGIQLLVGRAASAKGLVVYVKPAEQTTSMNTGGVVAQATRPESADIP